MRDLGLGALLAIAACTPEDPHLYAFGPFTVEAQQEDPSLCVQISLANPEPLFVNAVELTTGPGFHHSNWFFVPQHAFPIPGQPGTSTPDGTFKCSDRNFNIGSAAIIGGVLFAQSTQSTQELQQFPAGMAIRIPEQHKIVAQIHLLNRGDEKLEIRPTVRLETLAEAEVTKMLAGVSMEFHPLSLPPRMRSRFSVECDLGPRHREVFERDPDFMIYYTLAHYHQYGTRMMLEAVKDDGNASTIYTTANSIGDALGGPLSPPFSMTGYTRLRLSCEYYNNTDATIYYGNGDGEMCVFLAFSDSPNMWGGGAIDTTPDPSSGVVDNGVMTFTRNCSLFTREAFY